jgi:hypothetical protein
MLKQMEVGVEEVGSVEDYPLLKVHSCFQLDLMENEDRDQHDARKEH